MSTQYVTYKEAARILDRSYNTIRNLVSTGVLHSHHVRGEGFNRLDRVEVEGLKSARKTAQEAPAQTLAPMLTFEQRIAQAQEAIPSGVRDLVLVLLSNAASFYLNLKAKAAEQEKVLIEGYNTSLEKIAALGQQASTPAMAPEWVQQYMANPNPSREDTQELALHIPDAAKMLFPGADQIPPEQRPFIEEALAEGLGVIHDKLARMERERREAQEAQAREREKIPA